MNSRSKILEVKGLKTYFYTNDGISRAVDDVSFGLEKGMTLGLVGESGCGKTVTALSIMRLIQEPPGKIVDGQVLLGERNLLNLSPREMRGIRGNRISMIFQEPMTSLNPVFTVGNQISESIRLHRRVSKKEAADRSREMLRTVGIPDPEKRLHEYPHQLSGGMRQRVMIAMALCCDPEILIADEPTTALDVTIQAQILDLMNLLKTELNTCVVLITHDLGVVAEMAQTVAVMYAGKIVEYAGVEALFGNPGHPYTRGLMESIPKLEGPISENRMLKAIPGIVPDLLHLPEGCAFHNRCPDAFEHCLAANPPLLQLSPGHKARCWLYG